MPRLDTGSVHEKVEKLRISDNLGLVITILVAVLTEVGWFT